jgi:Ca2+-binding EF-hand superfamily protein
MKKIIAPIIASTLLIASTGSFAQSYAKDTTDDMVFIMDDNDDDKISFKEYYESTVTDNDDSFDVNKDGYITSGEIVLEIKEDLIQSIAEMRKQGVSEENINKTIASELNTAEKEAEALIKKMDLDGDNLVEPGEINAYKRQQFNALDKNRDNSISMSDVDGSNNRLNNITTRGDTTPSRNYSVVPYK